MAISIARAFATDAWFAGIGELGSSAPIEGLACAPNRIGSAEIEIGETQARQLAAQGLMPLIQIGEEGSVAFPAAPLLHKPPAP